MIKYEHLNAVLLGWILAQDTKFFLKVESTNEKKSCFLRLLSSHLVLFLLPIHLTLQVWLQLERILKPCWAGLAFSQTTYIADPTHQILTVMHRKRELTPHPFQDFMCYACGQHPSGVGDADHRCHHSLHGDKQPSSQQHSPTAAQGQNYLASTDIGFFSGP